MKQYIVCILLIAAFTLGAQSKNDLREEIANLKSESAKLKQEISELKKLIVNKETMERALQVEVNLLSDSLAIVQGALAMQLQNKIAQESQEDSLLLASVEQQEKLYINNLLSDPGLGNSSEKQRFFDRPGCSHCVKFQVFQSLFVEVAFIEYEIFPATKTFVGFYKYKYVPEFGELIFKVKKISGTYSETKIVRMLSLTKVDDQEVGLTLTHNLVKPRKSLISGNGLQMQQLYTKEVPLQKMQMVECY